MTRRFREDAATPRLRQPRAHALRLSADKAAMERVVAEKDATLAL
jgi:hypothetical protein